jgi:hypothetical protein
MSGANIIADFSQELLLEHNKLRERFGGVGELQLDEALSVKAQEHADYLAAKQSKLENSADETVGENLYYLESDDGKYTAQHIVEYWLRRSNFDFATKPTTTNHFTQIVWKSSSQLGVGVAKAANGAVYVAAFYWPRGNVVSLIEDNVIMRSGDGGGGSESVDGENGGGSGTASDNNNGSDEGGKNNNKDNAKSKEKRLEDKAINTLDKILKKADKEKTGKISLTKAKKVHLVLFRGH